MSTTTAISLLGGIINDFGIGALNIISTILGISMGILLINWGWTHLIKHFDMSIKIAGFYPLKTPYKGYKRFKSESWNMQNTA